jgi:hypothetical protein
LQADSILADTRIVSATMVDSPPGWQTEPEATAVMRASSSRPEWWTAGIVWLRRAASILARTDTLQLIAMTACVAAIWLATRRYSGIIHDSLLYTVQALHAIYPGRFDSDLYFKYGSQDQFTIFTYIYAPAIEWLGLSRANIVLTILGQAMWLAGLAYFIRGFEQRPTHLLMMVAVVLALPATYGFGLIFSYGEPFLTPRLPAEAMTMLAMGLLVRNRPLLAVAMVCLSAALHPIMTLPGLGVIFVQKAVRQWRWWVVGAAAAVLFVGLGAVGIAPFSRVVTLFDPEWFDVVRQRLEFAFISEWGVVDYCLIIATASLFALVWLLSAQQARTFLLPTAVVGIGGLLISLFGADIIRNVLVLNVQPWRVLWLATLVSHALLLPVFERLLADRGDRSRLLLAGMVTGVVFLAMARLFAGAVLLAAPVLLATALLGAWLRLGGRVHYPLARFIAMVIISVAIGGAFYLTAIFIRFNMAWPRGFLLSVGEFILSGAALGIALSIGLRTSISRRILALQTFVAIVLVCIGLFGWDQRRPWGRFIEATGTGQSSLDSLFPEQANVYWESGLNLMWLRLKRPAYFSCVQGTGVMFFRSTAVDYEHRIESFVGLRTLDFGSGAACPAYGANLSASSMASDLSYTCEREPRLDYLVLLHKVSGTAPYVWQAPFSAEYISSGLGRPTLSVQSTDRYFVYNCRDFRGGGTGAHN